MTSRSSAPNPLTERAELGIAPYQSLIGFVARFDPQKDHATLLHAMARLHQTGRAPLCLLICNGLDADNAALVAKIKVLGLGDHIRLLGRRSDIPAVMNALDLHIISSAFGEAFPNVLAEATTCGTPVVSTRVGDTPLIVGDTGHIVPPRDPQALADAVTTMLAEVRGPGAAERRKAASDHIAAHFTITMMAEKYRAVWQR